jgi:hypothetical protein
MARSPAGTATRSRGREAVEPEAAHTDHVGDDRRETSARLLTGAATQSPIESRTSADGSARFQRPTSRHDDRSSRAVQEHEQRCVTFGWDRPTGRRA